ncbi:hypothetical protein B0H34DRAFT_446175 [Crassisporium funariophilum]|nr:hypothetical protein B0H34DRAFT_446175 [Crassisporium funariophilum]
MTDRRKQSPPRISSSSYVYPVKSLLSGRIQPAPEFYNTPRPSAPHSAGAVSPDSPISLRPSRSGSVAAWTKEQSDQGFSSLFEHHDDPNLPIPSDAPNIDTASSISPGSTSSPTTSASDSPAHATTRVKRSHRRFSRKDSPNFRHFPAEDNPSSPRVFSRATSTLPTSSSSSAYDGTAFQGANLHGDGTTNLSQQNLDSFQNLHHPAPLPLIASAGMSATSPTLLPTMSIADELSNALPRPDLGDPPPLPSVPPLTPIIEAPQSGLLDSIAFDPLATPVAEYPNAGIDIDEDYSEEPSLPELPFNPSEYGLVHLPPLPPSRTNSESSYSVNSSLLGSRKGNSNTSKRSNRTDGQFSVGASSRGKSSASASSHAQSSASAGSQNPQFLSSGSGSGANSSGQSQRWSSEPPSGSDVGSSGQELRSPEFTSSGSGSGANSSGQSQRSGSEPPSGSDIGSSSATSEEPYVTVKFQYQQDVNGNHVVVGREGKLQRCEDEPISTPGAVQGFGVLIAVDELADTLVVRQVSENSTELLGLPPKFLFGLECFTDTLPESQAAILWDNIQFLTEPDLMSEEEESSPHVFLLSGWGAPGSAFQHDVEYTDGKRTWTCWCAVHRAQAYSSTDSLTSGLIVMEFELERDGMNPLYPPPVVGVPSGVTSPTLSTAGSSLSQQSLVDTPTTEERESSASPSVGSGSDQSTVGASSADGSSTSLGSIRGSVTSLGTSGNVPSSLAGLDGEDDWRPSAEDILESTTSRARPLPALERLRRMTRGGTPYGTSPQSGPDSSSRTRRGARRAGRTSATVGMMDVFAVMAQINEQLGAAPDLNTFLKVVVGVIKDLTQFHRVLVYQFDEMWNGQVVAELVDWGQSHDLFRGLHFPAGDIPAQARELYSINKVRLLYDRAQPTARIVVRNKDDLEKPLNMTHCYLRAMSPIHIKYLENMGVRASMSVSILAFGQLWGLVTCHSYGAHGMRVSFPVRQMLRLLSQSISRNIERLSYAQRLHTRKLINTLTSDNHPTGYIVSNADDLLGLFDADFGILVVGEGAKILGPNQHGQEILIMAEYLRLKQYDTIQASQAVVNDFPDLQLTTGFEIIAGLLYVPLSSGGKDFIAFLRRGQLREVHWAGKPHKDSQSQGVNLEPRKSFKIWSETVAGRCRKWTDEQLETAGVLALVYGKFIEVWRQKESALQTTKLTNLLLSNASHEVRTPLNHIINYLEMALNGPLDNETRDNLSRSHAASKSLLFTINDLLDLTRLESGNETSFNEPFDLHFTIEEATHLYKKEAERRNIKFTLDLAESPTIVVGDAKKIRTVVQNLTANSLKYTREGSITVCCTTYGEPEGLRSTNQTAVEIVVGDTGCGISPDKLDSIFREFEQVESSEPKSNSVAGVGLGLAVVARIVEQLGGQLRVDSKLNEGSCFSFLIPLSLSGSLGDSNISSPMVCARTGSMFSGGSDIENLVEALSSNHMSPPSSRGSMHSMEGRKSIEQPKVSPRPSPRQPTTGIYPVTDSHVPVRPVKIDDFESGVRSRSQSPNSGVCGTVDGNSLLSKTFVRRTSPTTLIQDGLDSGKLRVLIVEDNDINRTILSKRLTLKGHTVVNTTNGQEGLDKVVSDRSFDAVLMDIQMPILNGFEATQKIRELEENDAKNCPRPHSRRLSHALNGRIPVFAVSASLMEQQREELAAYGVDGWILKPIDFTRLNDILKGVTDPVQRKKDVYRAGCNWEAGGWLKGRPET